MTERDAVCQVCRLSVDEKLEALRQEAARHPLNPAQQAWVDARTTRVVYQRPSGKVVDGAAEVMRQAMGDPGEALARAAAKVAAQVTGDYAVRDLARLTEHNETFRTRLADAESRARLATSRAERAERVVEAARPFAVFDDPQHRWSKDADGLRHYVLASISRETYDPAGDALLHALHDYDRHAETTAPHHSAHVVHHAEGCAIDSEHDSQFVCDGCRRLCASCFGAADRVGAFCDDCAAKDTRKVGVTP